VRKTPIKKRTTLRPRSNVDPTRVALAALERIKTVLVKSGHQDRLGEPLSMRDLAAQAQILGTELPPSYVAAMRVASRIGEPENLLAGRDIAQVTEQLLREAGEEGRRYAPFCKTNEAIVCFDKGADMKKRHEGEMPIIEWREGGAAPLAAHFGEWLDMVADARDEKVESAAKMPQRLKRLLYELGFRFEYPVVGRLETGDVASVEELIGPEVSRSVRGDVDRLFDSSGKASMTLNVDEFTIAVSLRTGIFVFEAEDVFRWLRYFRDENFFSDSVREPTHPDNVRDLRRAPREPPVVLRGTMFVTPQAAQRHVFRAASGMSATDFYLLGRTASTSVHAPSVVLHVVEGVVASEHHVNEPLHDLYIARDGTMWGLTTSHAVRFSGGREQAFPLTRPSTGRPWWYGIGGGGDRVLVWGAGALLEFDGSGFVSFEPDAMLDDSESVVALSAQGLRIAMLVVGDRMGAVARFDSAQWLPIGEDQVIDASLSDLDWWRGTAYVLDRDGALWAVEDGPPAAVELPSHHQAFLTESGTRRALHGVSAFDGGFLLATDGGAIAVGRGDPVFHAVQTNEPKRDAVRLVRVAPRTAAEIDAAPKDNGIVALSGGNVWVWRSAKPEAGFQVIDMREW